MRKHRGLFITFEGTAEGLGKTVQSHNLYERLIQAGHDAVLTHQPGGTVVGERIREMILHADYKLSKAAVLFLLMADRAQHYKEVVKPSLQDGKIVVCDRYFDSTLTYQGNGQGWKSAFLWRLHHAAAGSLLPDLTLVLDGVPHRKRFTDDRFEKMDDAFHSRVKRGMLHLATKSDRYVLLDANTADSVLADRVFAEVTKRLNQPSETLY